MGATCNLVACDCNGGPKGIICGGNSYQQQLKTLGAYDPQTNGYICMNGTAGNILGAVGGGGGATWVASSVCGDPIGVYIPDQPYYIEQYPTKWVSDKIQIANVYWSNLTFSNTTTITLGDNMGCNAKEQKFTYRWEITVVDISKTKTDNREVIRKTVWVDTNVDSGKILLKYAKDINDALAAYNTNNSAEVTLDDCYVQAKYHDAIQLKDSD